MILQYIKENSGLFVPISLALLATLTSPQIAQSADPVTFSEIEQQRGLPSRGQTSQTVINNHGEPTSKQIPIGNPPIKSWQYTDFIVYFERDLVITTITNEDRLPEKLDGIVQN